jgi:GNAT superfamily N-acetyltransferase
MPQRSLLGEPEEHGHGVFHCREFVDADDERIAWVFAVERSGFMEVEELFVRPRFRRNGYGTRLIRSIRELTLGRKCHLKGWISYADVAPENLIVLRKFLSSLGLVLKQSNVRWAPCVATVEADATQPAEPSSFQLRKPIASIFIPIKPS